MITRPSANCDGPKSERTYSRSKFGLPASRVAESGSDSLGPPSGDREAHEPYHTCGLRCWIAPLVVAEVITSTSWVSAWRCVHRIPPLPDRKAGSA